MNSAGNTYYFIAKLYDFKPLYHCPSPSPHTSLYFSLFLQGKCEEARRAELKRQEKRRIKIEEKKKKGLPASDSDTESEEWDEDDDDIDVDALERNACDCAMEDGEGSEKTNKN